MGSRKAYLPGATLAHLLAREEGRMGTAACGVHPFHPDQWQWDLVTAGRLDLCRRCHTSQQENSMDHPFAEHYRAQDTALVDAQEALRSAMSDLERAQDVLTSAAITDEHWQGCCSRQTETEGVEVAVDVAERCLQGALRVLDLRRERLSVLLEEEQ